MSKIKLGIYVLFLSSLGFISFSSFNNEPPHSIMKMMGGPPYNTNAPGEKTCSGGEGTSPCHSGGIPDNSGPSTCSIISSGGTMYVPGQTYTITPTITHPTRTRFGFQLSVRRLSNNANAGDIIILDTNITRSQIPTWGSCQTCEFAMHTLGGIDFAGTTGQWSFAWTAPSTNIGNIRMYACFNASNSSNTERGEETYFTTLTLTPSSTGINEQNILSEVNISPNPAKEYFNFQINAPEAGKILVDIYSLDGKIVRNCLEKNIFHGKTNEVILLEEQLKPGIYFVRTSLNDKISLKKIIVLEK